MKSSEGKGIKIIKIISPNLIYIWDGKYVHRTFILDHDSQIHLDNDLFIKELQNEITR